ncbi:MAG: hypothetical protein DHS20C16_00490 [Phycisphaerae bacterium]|nr:MAG: hypothetical protein DHS20C16_00490 [Phycisphaerae bacterium]
MDPTDSIPTRRKRRWGRRILWAFVALVTILAITAVVGWFAFQKIPSWYKPVRVASGDLTRIRNSLPNTYDSLNAKIQKGETFDFTLIDRTVSEWIVARAELYPDAEAWLPRWLRDPVVVFDDNRAIIGARVDYQGWRAIVGIHLTLDITNETITARITKVTAGALPVPLSQLVKPIEDFLKDEDLDVETMPDPAALVFKQLQKVGPAKALTDGLKWRNVFKAPNSPHVIKLRGASTANGELKIRIEPR